MSGSVFGMRMLFTNSGKQGGSQQGGGGSSQQGGGSGKQTARTLPPPIQLQQIRSFPPSSGFRGMDLGNLKNSKSCGSCGH
jgi:hypothetical protein